MTQALKTEEALVHQTDLGVRHTASAAGPVSLRPGSQGEGLPHSQPLSQLDFVRSVAVLLVFFGHLVHTLGYDHFIGSAAHLGVLLFFVHTCVVLFMSMERLSRDRGSLSARFYLRRIFRIYPLSIVTVLLVVILHIPATSWDSNYLMPSARTVASNLALVQNLTGSRSITAPLWSLPFEIQIYAVLPLLFLLYPRKSAGAMWIWGGALSAAIFAFALNSTAGAVLQYAPCFCAGVVAYDLTRRRAVLPFRMLVSLLGILLLGFVASASLLHYFSAGQLAVALNDWLASIIAGAVIGRSAPPGSAIVRKISGVIAKYSYGIYLSHLPLMWLFLRPNHTITHFAIFIIAMLVVPPLAYHGLEHPMIQLGNRCIRQYWPSSFDPVASGGPRLARNVP
jgi:peptidoglycan/LPS O-acetylase OafA/YrhL